MINLTYLNNPTFYPPQMQSHRGYCDSTIKENTLESIQNSFHHGYKMAEFDVRLTADGVVVLYHDYSINHQPIHKMTYSELAMKINVTTLESVLIWLSRTNASATHSDDLNTQFLLNIEIKSKFIFDRKLESAVLKILLQYQQQNSVLISSFNPLSLAYFKNYQPDIPRSLLLTYSSDYGNNFIVKSQILNIFARPHFLHLDEKYWNKKMFRKLLLNKIPIILWTCNDAEKIKKYFEEGVYGVISDSITPDKLRLEN